MGASVPTLFHPNNYSTAAPVGTGFAGSFTSSLSGAVPAGTYDVGLCARNRGPALDRDDWVDGYAMVIG